MDSVIEKIRFVGIDGDLIIELSEDNTCCIYPTSPTGIFKIDGRNMDDVVNFFRHEVTTKNIA